MQGVFYGSQTFIGRWCADRVELAKRRRCEGWVWAFSQAAVENFVSSLQCLLLRALASRTYSVRLYLCDSFVLDLLSSAAHLLVQRVSLEI